MKTLHPLLNSIVLTLGLASAALAAPSFAAFAPRPGQPGPKVADCSTRAEQIARDTQAAIDRLTADFDQAVGRMVVAYRQELLQTSGAFDAAVRLTDVHERYQEMLESLSDLFTDIAIPNAMHAGLKSLSALPCGGAQEGAVVQRAEQAKVVVQQTEAAASAAMRQSLAELTIE